MYMDKFLKKALRRLERENGVNSKNNEDAKYCHGNTEKSVYLL